jgi:predicted DCC family thiol-disulfide oxidoreductase YuxK
MSADLVFYDGACGLCHSTVLFLLKRDADGSRFRFSPLQGETFAARISRVDLPDSVIVLTAEGEVLIRSAGVVHLLRRLGGGWALVGVLLRLIPRLLRDWGYDRVAAMRRFLFRKPEGACPLVPARLRPRFLP